VRFGRPCGQALTGVGLWRLYKAKTTLECERDGVLGGHVLFETGIRRLGSKESGFFYRFPGTGETVREERILARIKGGRRVRRATRSSSTWTRAALCAT
jgi:hypothetical protein